MTIVGATLPKILSSFSWDYGTAGLVLASGAIGYFISTWLSGKLLAPLGPRLSVAVGLGLDAFGLALFAASPSPLLNLVLYFCVGLGQGFFEVPVNWSVMRMESLAAMEEGRPANGRALSLMHAAYAVGAVAGPFVLGWLLAAGMPWVSVYRGIAVIFALLLGILFLLPFGLLGREEPEIRSANGSRKPLWRERGYWLGFATLFLYVGVEIGISNWSAEYYVSRFGASAVAGSFMVSLFWLGLLVGRLGFPVLAAGLPQEKLLTRLAAALALATGLLAAAGFVGPDAVLVAALLFFLAGLACSSIYPVAMSMVGTLFPRSQGEAMGFAATGGGLGAFAFPYLMSVVAGGFGITIGFVVYAFFALATWFVASSLAHCSRQG